MVKRLLSMLLFLVLTTSTYASHIVGGEFELLHVSGTTYTLNLILYFDVVNGNPEAQDANVLAAIFKKSDNSSIRTITLPFVSQNRVEYFQPVCSSGEVVTDRLLYSTSITLGSETYNDPEGYYIAWERCCRNYTISNIFSEVPNNGSANFAGQTFYLEFPAVVDEEGEPFVNSSPQLFPPLNDYGCPFRPYWVDFAGTDIDGDSLVYKLVTPLNTHYGCAIADSSNPVCNDPNATRIGAHPGPYTDVNWRPGFDLDNILGGDPDLKIDDDGFLTVTPIQEGLFVFAVECTEYRDGVQIGRLIRDFQLLVLDNCPVAEPPVVLGKKLTDGSFTDSDILNVTFQNTETDATRCINIHVSDPDSANPQNSQSEDISIKVIALNFDANNDELGVLLPDVTSATLTNGNSEIFEICFPECPFLDPQESDFFEIGVVAFDDACTLPLSDTLTVRVRVIPPDNTAPEILSSGNSVPALSRTEVQGAGKSIAIPIKGQDADGHNLLMQINTVEEFDLAKAGMSFSYVPSEEFEVGPINTTFTWNLDCNDAGLDFSEGVTISEPDVEVVKSYNFEILLEDEDDCDFGREDLLEMQLNIKFPGEFAPVVHQVGQSDQLRELKHEYKLTEAVDITIEAKDGGTDEDNINLTAVGSNFNLNDYGIVFENKTNQSGTITTPFHWSLDCEKFNLTEIDSFRVFFITEDIDACNLANKDTLAVDFLIDTLTNTTPVIQFESPQIVNNQISTDIREKISVNVLGYDIDMKPDSLFLKLLAVNGSRDVDGFEFSDVEGIQSVSSILTWTPDCDALEELDPGSYRFTFTLKDNNCPTPLADTVSLDVIVNDIENITSEFLPPNVFTPGNGDELNEYFGMFDFVDGQEVNILPTDNCEGVFQSVEIFNRWGKEVYSSTDRDFKWLGQGQPTGVYFYQIKYSHKIYKGSVSILY